MIRAFILALVLALASAGAQSADLQSFGRGSWSKLRAAHDGQPTVVHFWGLTCAPCLVEMPEWGKLRAERPDMRLVMVAADPVPQDPARVSRHAGARRSRQRPRTGPSPTASTSGCATRSIRPGPASCRAPC